MTDTMAFSGASDGDLTVADDRCDLCGNTSDQWGWLNVGKKRIRAIFVCRPCCEARGHRFWDGPDGG